MLKKFVSVIVVYALLFGGLSLSVPAAALKNINAAKLTAAFGEKVLVCTESGYKWVKWADVKNTGHKDKPDCKACHASCVGHAANIVSQTALSNPQTLSLASNAKEQVGYVPLFNYTHSPPRSPPIYS
jgi:hypothetical protein